MSRLRLFTELTVFHFSSLLFFANTHMYAHLHTHTHSHTCVAGCMYVFVFDITLCLMTKGPMVYLECVVWVKQAYLN